MQLRQSVTLADTTVVDTTEADTATITATPCCSAWEHLLSSELLSRLPARQCTRHHHHRRQHTDMGTVNRTTEPHEFAVKTDLFSTLTATLSVTDQCTATAKKKISSNKNHIDKIKRLSANCGMPLLFSFRRPLTVQPGRGKRSRRDRSGPLTKRGRTTALRSPQHCP